MSGQCKTFDQDKGAPIQQIVLQVRLMCRYALAEGLLIDDNAQKILAAVNPFLTAPDGKLPSTDSIDAGPLLQAHAILAHIIVPATPISLDATEPTSGWLGSLRRPPLIQWMIVIAVLSAAGFVLTCTVFPEANLNSAFAASLGAVFYVLFTAHSYVKDRTFDPRYNSHYVIRYVLGVLAGLILAFVLKNVKVGQNIEPTYSQSLIAMMGGFCTEAVNQILQRVVEILVAAVRGDGADAAKAHAGLVAQREFLSLAEDQTVPADIRAKLLAAAKKMGA
jgi:hypothetical protein